MKTTTLLLLSILFFSSCEKKESGLCYDFTINHQIECTPNDPTYNRVNETYVETKCGFEDNDDAEKYIRVIELRSNNKIVGNYLFIESFRVTKIKLTK
jgi:hypothetical protein